MRIAYSYLFFPEIQCVSLVINRVPDLLGCLQAYSLGSWALPRPLGFDINGADEIVQNTIEVHIMHSFSPSNIEIGINSIIISQQNFFNICRIRLIFEICMGVVSGCIGFRLETPMIYSVLLRQIWLVVVVVYLTTNQRHLGYLSSGNGHLAGRYSIT